MRKNIFHSHEHFLQNEQGRDFFVGDIHGHLALLMSTLASIGFDKSKDRLFCAGDIINRGENSPGCIELLLEPWFFSVWGNHEELFLSLIDGDSAWASLLKVGGQWLNDFKNDFSRFRFLLAVVYGKMCFSMTVDTSLGQIGVVHAQSPDDWRQLVENNLSEDEAAACLWSLERFNRPGAEDVEIKNISLTVHGHTNSEAVVVKKNQVWIDTLRTSGKLTVLSAEELFSLVEGADV